MGITHENLHNYHYNKNRMSRLWFSTERPDRYMIHLYICKGFSLNVTSIILYDVITHKLTVFYIYFPFIIKPNYFCKDETTGMIHIIVFISLSFLFIFLILFVLFIAQMCAWVRGCVFDLCFVCVLLTITVYDRISTIAPQQLIRFWDI